MLTDKGFYRPTYDELLEAQQKRARQLLGEDVDTSNLSVLGKYIRINVDDFDKLWQTLEQVYYARFPNTSTGVSLERLCTFAGITRNPATHAKHLIRITGTEGTVIEGGFLVATDRNEQTFHTYEDYVLSRVHRDNPEAPEREERATIFHLYHDGTISEETAAKLMKSISRFDEEQLKRLLELGFDNGGISQKAYDILTVNIETEIMVDMPLKDPIKLRDMVLVNNAYSEEEIIEDFYYNVPESVSVDGISEQAKEELLQSLADVEKSEPFAYIPVYAVNVGTEGNVSVGSIKTVVNPLPDVQETVKHVAIMELAEEIESDYKLRKRFSEAISGAGATTMDAIKGAIMRVNNVQNVYIQENDTNTFDPVTGVEPHSFECYVLVEDKEAAKQAIAEAILLKKAVGIRPTGKEVVQIKDSTGVEHGICFSWTEEKKIKIRMHIDTNSKFPEDGKDRIKQNITDFVSELTNGDTLYYTSLFGKIHIEGVESVTMLEFSADGVQWGKDDVTCDVTQVIRVDEEIDIYAYT